MENYKDKLKEILYIGLGLAKETKSSVIETYDKYLNKGKREDKSNTVDNIVDGIESTGNKIKTNLSENLEKLMELMLPKR